MSKCKYQLLPTGKVIIIPSKKNIYRQRRKLVKIINKKNNIDEVKTTIVSFSAYLNMGNGYQYITYLKDKFKGIIE